MPTTPFVPLPDGLVMTAVSEGPGELLIRAVSKRPCSPCPLCGQPSFAIHSYYRRKPADLPCAGHPIRLLLTVRKFFCRNSACPRKVFTERLPELLQPASRLTTRLREALQSIGFALNGEGGARLARRLGLPISATTLLRSLHLVPTAPVGKVRVVGLDDWAWRRGQRYGTIIIDQERHVVLDLLPERTPESVQKWLESHPEVEFVSRDRGGTYVDGATWGAPQATQIADRWHILANLGQAVEEFLIRTHVRLVKTPTQEPTVERPLTSYSTTPDCQGKSQARLLQKWKLYQRVQELHGQGMGIIKIGIELGLARNTVRKYLRKAPDPPLPTPRPLRESGLDRYEDDILKRWKEGERNAAQLFREISALGYQGANTTVRAYVRHLRTTTKDGSVPVSRKQRTKTTSPRALRWLLTRERKDLDAEEQARLDQLLTLSPDITCVRTLLHTFLNMVRERQPEQLRPWMQEAEKSGIAELKSFVGGIERDYDAVKAALCLPWNQGQTEGFVNKLKTAKRMMYGRAGFELLRQRLLHAV
ncbi:MAG: ISL3 family transposase [Ktedonobacteraceae bacterium]|nr:ISL3 family transposase [Ktedonobacteraceae bacterium]